MTRTITLMLVGLAALVVAASALATSTATLHIQPTAVKPGGKVHVWGNAGACAAGSRLLVLSNAFPEVGPNQGGVTSHVKANHTFSLHRRLRGNVTAGNWSVSVRCAGADLGVAGQVLVK